MAIKKQEVEVKSDSKVLLKKFLAEKMPAMFDRTPDITGDLNKFVDDIIKIVK